MQCLFHDTRDENAVVWKRNDKTYNDRQGDDSMKMMTYSGSLTDQISDREILHRNLACKAAEEGIVLLKNEGGLLPLAKEKKLALYGSGALYTLKGGTGSGDVNNRNTSSLLEGLEKEGFEISSHSWLDDYQKDYESARLEWRDRILAEAGRSADGNALFDVYAAHPFTSPAGRPVNLADLEGSDTDTAVFVISRQAGEGKDREIIKGDYYLSDHEESMIRSLTGYYKNVILVINSGGAIDLSFIDAYKEIRAILYISQPGMAGGDAAAAILSGRICPSGRLSSTWAYRYQDYPNAENFSHNNGNLDEEVYSEGIFVGYRYFDSFRVKARYPFGYGLSYTSFSISAGMPKDCHKETSYEISFRTRVRNTGERPGKEIVQLYAVCPQTEAIREYKQLCAFEKTPLLMPGEETEVCLNFDIASLAFYAEKDSSYRLPKGTYYLMVGSSSDQLVPAAALRLTSSVVVRKLTSVCSLQKSGKDMAPYINRMEDSYQKVAEKARKTGVPVLNIRGEALAEVCQARQKESGKRLQEAEIYSDAVKDCLDKMTLDEKLLLLVGRHAVGEDNIALGAAGVSVPGAAGETCPIVREGISIPAISLADGPAGLRLAPMYTVGEDGKPNQIGFKASMENGFFMNKEDLEAEGTTYYQYCTAFPAGTLLAQTWNLPLLEEIGRAVAAEMAEFGVSLWLAPGMNIQRNPLCGRNFEYYSEDPLLSGKLAAAITKGVQSRPGTGTTVKHFCCNNNEDNRMGVDALISERALREIYLRNFEIAVREAAPMALMTSYNLINGIHAANNRDLLEQVLRKEWGFQGMVMTDWTTTSPTGGSLPWKCIEAGNDLIMPGNDEDMADIRKALEEGRLTMDQVDLCLARIIRLILSVQCD